jgi:transcriptional regulator with XRE-family HTH domain
MFSQLLYSHRRRRSMSQEDLARRTGITARSIRNLEGGSVRSPRPGTVRRLADGLALDGADRERFESAAVGTYLDAARVAASAGPGFVVTEGTLTAADGGVTVQWTREPQPHRADCEFRVTIRGFTAPHLTRQPANLLRAVLDALGAAHDPVPPSRAPDEP